MASSRPQVNGGQRRRIWFRRSHRWLGSLLIVFVLILATSGVALNHAADLGLDRRHVQWSWLLDAYGIRAAEPTASFAADGHRATLLGKKLWFDGVPVTEDVAQLKGMVALGPLVLVAAQDEVFVLTSGGELVEAIDPGADMRDGIDRVGRAGDVAVLESGGTLYRSDADVTAFTPGAPDSPEDIRWSVASAPSPEDVAALQSAYRGEGLTVERVLLDLHSGRIFSRAGTLVMDFVAICMVILSLSGLVLSVQRSRLENGRRR